MAISFDRINKLVIVGTPDTEVTVQQLINAVRDYEDEPSNLDVPSIATASGKEDLGGGLSIGITMKLIDWKVKFDDRTAWTSCEVKGGNLICWDTYTQKYVNPVSPAAYVTSVRTSSVSAAIIENDHLAIADTVWDEALSGHVQAGSIGEKIKKLITTGEYIALK